MKLNAKSVKEAEIRKIIEEGLEKAAVATQAHIDANPGVWFPCGFAWVNIKPARGPFVKVMKDMDLGRTDDYYGGFTIWNPSQNVTQWLDAKMWGAKAFAEHLRIHGLKANYYTRMD